MNVVDIDIDVDVDIDVDLCHRTIKWRGVETKPAAVNEVLFATNRAKQRIFFSKNFSLLSLSSASSSLSPSSSLVLLLPERNNKTSSPERMDEKIGNAQEEFDEKANELQIKLNEDDHPT